MSKEKAAGFTLVEIMIVVSIIGLLAVLAVPSYMQARTEGQISLCLSNLLLIDSAKELFALGENKRNGDPAPSGTDLDPYMKRPFTAMKEPVGGAYSINDIGTPPACSVGSDHTLPGA